MTSSALRTAAVCVLSIAVALAFGAAPASAEHIHAVSSEFGPDGTAATSWGELNTLAYQQATKRLYALGANGIYGFSNSSAGTFAPLGGNFPIGGISSSTNSDIAVDNSATASAGHIIYNADGPTIVGYNSSGSSLGFTINAGGENCGVAVDDEGNIWGATYQGAQVQEWSSSGGSAINSLSVGNSTGNPCKIGVDNSNNDVYVSAYGSPTVAKFTKASNYTSFIQLAGLQASNNRIAVNATRHVVYVGSPYGNEIFAYSTATGALLETFTISGGTVKGLAVQESTDTVFVANSDGKIDEMQGIDAAKATTGEPIANTTVSGTADPDGAGEIIECYFEYGLEGPNGNHPYGSKQSCSPGGGINAVTPVEATLSGLLDGETYHYRLALVDANGKAVGADKTIIPHYVKGLKTEDAENVTRTSATLKASFEGNGEATKYYFEWGTTETYGTTSAPPPGISAGSPTYPPPSPLSFNATNLQPATVYHYRVVAENGLGITLGADKTFETLPAVQNLITEPATNITSSTATMNGSFEGNGEATKYYFAWGKSAFYSFKTTLEETGGNVPVAVSFTSTNLAPGTTYHYRVVAENSAGRSFGQDQSFETSLAAPSVIESVSGVQSDLALLHAQINPGGGSTTYHFEYGTAACSASPCTKIPIPDGTIAPGTSYQPVSAQLSGLTSGTTYYYRVAAENTQGTTYGPDRTFTTYGAIPFSDPCPNAHVRQQVGAALLPDCRAYELVSAADAGGYDVESTLVGGQTPYPSYPEAEDPSRVLYAVHDGGIPGTANPTNRGPDPYVATRGETGWSTEYVGVPANNPFSAAPFTSVPSSADSSLETFAFGGSEGCSPCFEGGYTGIPVHKPNGELVQGMVPSSSVTAPGPGAKPDGYVAKDLSADGSHLVFGSTSKFAEGGDSGGAVSIYDRDLTTEETHVVSNSSEVAGQPLPCLQIAGEGECHAPTDSNGIAELDISRDGSHILLAQKVSEGAGNSVFWRLYMNVDDSPKTIDLTPGATDGVLYDGMTADGSKVFFSSDEHLTGENVEHSGTSIYEAEVGEGGTATLHLISKGDNLEAPGEPGNTASCDPVSDLAHVHWNTTGSEPNCGVVAIGGGGGVASGDGTVYFLSPEKLDGNTNGVQNAPNLYVVRPGQATHFVATLESSLTGPQPPVTYHPLTRHFGNFSTPRFVAVDNSGGPSNGDVYVDDSGTSTIYKFDPSGALITSWGEHGKLNVFSAGITVGPSGALYVLDGNQMSEYSQGGALSTRFRFNYGGEEYGMAVDPEGNFYTISYAYAGGNVMKFDPSGNLIAGNFTSPGSMRGLAIDPSGENLYVDHNGEAIERYSLSSSCTESCSEVVVSGLSGGEGIAVGASGIYVAEGNRVLQFDFSGNQVGAPIGAGLLVGSKSVALDSAGDVFATNRTPGDIDVFGPSEPRPDPTIESPTVTDAIASSETRHTADFQVAPNGEFATFTSTLPLTGFESAGNEEIYRYDSASESLACVSCDPTGVEPTANSELPPDGLSLTNEGRVFFTTAEPLVERDADARKDVYEWEPQGSGPEAALCRESSPTFSTTSGGCLNLLSTGTSAFDSSLLGASSNGLDAYFFSRDKLVPQAENGSFVKIYDARQGGGFEYTPPPIPCKASDECHGPSSPVPPPPNISLNTGTSGNQVPQCKAGFVEKHGHCAKKSHNPKRRHKRAHHRGGSR